MYQFHTNSKHNCHNSGTMWLPWWNALSTVSCVAVCGYQVNWEGQMWGPVQLHHTHLIASNYNNDIAKLQNYRQSMVIFSFLMITLVCSFLNSFRRCELSLFSLCSLRSRTLSAETVIHLLIASSLFS
jgi:hypothetical protein